MNMNHMSRKYISPLFALILVLTLVMGNLTGDLVRAEEKIQYISDIRIFQSNDRENALKICREKGYTPVVSDLNSGGGGEFVYLGYKTTENRDEAITDLSVLQMGNGYEIRSYEEILEYQLPRFELLAQETYSIIPEFRANLAKHSPAAEMALKVLNYYYYDDEDMLLGDFLLSEKCDRDSENFEPDLLPYLLQRGSSSLADVLYSTFIPAVADYNEGEYVEGEYPVNVEKAPEMPTDFDYFNPVEEGDRGIKKPDETTTAETAKTAETTETTAAAESAGSTDLTDETSGTAENTEGSEPSDSTGETADSTSLTEETSTAAAEETTAETTQTAAQTEREEEPEEEPDAFEPEIEEEEALLKCDMNYGNWASRISKTGMVELYENGEIDDEIVNTYNSSVRLIKKSVQTFASNYLDAKARLDAYGAEALIPEASYEELLEKENSDADEMVYEAKNADLYYLQAYQMLDEYEYNDEMSIAEYLVEIGSVAYLDDDYELLPFYPLAAALTNAQVYLMQVNGVAPLVMYLNNNNEVTKQAAASFHEIDSRLKEAGLGESISVWAGVDRTKYDQRFAETNQTLLKDRAGKNLTTYTSVRGPLAVIDEIISYIQTISTIVGAVAAVISVASSVLVAQGVLSTGITVSACFSYAMSGGVLAFFLGGSGCLVMGLSQIGLLVSLGIMVYQIGAQVYRMHFYEEDYVDAAFNSEIPGMVIDSNKSDELLYYYPAYKEPLNLAFLDMLQGFSGTATIPAIRETLNRLGELYRKNNLYGDTNGGNGKDDRWNAICWTKDEHAGSPLRLDADGNCFVVQKDNNRVPAGCTPVNNFNEITPSNLNDYVDKSGAPAIFLFYMTEESLENPVSEGEDRLNTTPNYLSGLMLAAENTTEKAVEALQNQGYQPITSNLTPQIEGKVTLLGYQISDKVGDALTDIRVLPKDSAASVNDKEYQLLGVTEAGDKIYTSKTANGGQPILAEFQVISSIGNRKPAFKPMQTFENYPYDFISCTAFNPESENAGVMNDDTRMFFTYQQSQKYLSALKLATGRSREQAIAGLIRQGYQYIDRNLTPKTKTFTYLGYKGSDTPDRCITDIRILPSDVDFDNVKNYERYTLLGVLSGSGDIVYYSNNDRAGDAIVADFGVRGAYEDADEEEKLVSVFDGQAYDFAAAKAYAPQKALSDSQLDALVQQSDSEQAADEAAAEAAAENGETVSREDSTQPADKDKIFLSYATSRKPLYVSAVSVVSFYGNESAGKELLKAQGFHYIDINLTRNVYRTYTYFGYMTTTAESSSLRDIRVGAAYMGSSAVFGGASYGLGTGNNKKMGITSQGDGIFQTSFASNGDPILADFIVVSDPNNAPAGYEPILTFGGLPYNFGRCKTNEGPLPKWDWDYHYQGSDLYNNYFKNVRAAYIYYRPSVAYKPTNPDGSEATKYISGVTTLVGNSDKDTAGKFTQSYANRFGSTVVSSMAEDDLIKGTDYSQDWYDITKTAITGHPVSHMIINYTYNPKRALTDLRSYTALPGSQGISPCMGSQANGAYFVEDTILTMKTNTGAFRSQIPVQILGYNPHLDWFHFEDVTNGIYEEEDNPMLREDFEEPGYWTGTYSKGDYSTTWTKSALRYKAIYGCGPVKGKAPLKADELVIVNDTKGYKDNADWKPVVDFRTPNATTPHNLAFRPKSGGGNQIYMFLKRPLPTEKKYISGVALAVSADSDTVRKALRKSISGAYADFLNSSDGSYETCLNTLTASCTDEILPRSLHIINSRFYQIIDRDESVEALIQRLVGDDPAVQEAWLQHLVGDFSAVSEMLPWVRKQEPKTLLEIYGDVFKPESEQTTQTTNRIRQNETNVENTPKQMILTIVNKLLDSTDYQENSFSGVQKAYLGVSRTDNPNEAIRGLLKYKPENGFAPGTITVDGIAYTKCGEGAVFDLMEEYYLYQTTSLAAGDPITAIDFDDICYAYGSKTAKSATAENKSVLKNGYTAKVDENALIYLHCYCDSSLGYVDQVYLGTGTTTKKAALDLMNQGATNILDIDLNEGTGHPIYLGYSKAGTADDAIYDLIAVTGEQPQLRDLTTKAGALIRKVCTVNGLEYTPVVTSSGEPICVNEADHTYLYYRLKANGKETPIAKIGVSEKDRVPDSTNLLQPWEHVLTADGVKFNLNQGRVIFEDEQEQITAKKNWSQFWEAGKRLTDGRVYLFALRNEKNGVYVKPGAEITGGVASEQMEYADLQVCLN